MFNHTISRRQNNKLSVNKVSELKRNELEALLYNNASSYLNLNQNLEYIDNLSKENYLNILKDIENINNKIYILKKNINSVCINGTIEQNKANIQILEYEKQSLLNKIYDLNKNMLDFNMKFNSIDNQVKNIRLTKLKNVSSPSISNSYVFDENQTYVFDENQTYNIIEDEYSFKNLSSKDLDMDNKIIILDKILNKIQENTIKDIKIPQPLITILSSDEDFIEYIKGEIEFIQSFKIERKTIYDNFLNELKRKNPSFSEKDYEKIVKISKEICPNIDDQLAQKDYENIDLNIQTQTRLNKLKHALSNINRDGTPLTDDPDRIALAKRYKEHTITNSKKISKFTGIDFFINSIKSSDKTEDYINIIEIKYKEFTKNINEKIEIKPSSLEVFANFSHNNKDIGQIHNITSCEKSAFIIALTASIVDVNIYYDNKSELLNKEESIFQLFSKIQDTSLRNSTSIFSQIYKYIDNTILHILNNNLVSYEFPPIVIFTDNSKNINYNKINSYKNELVSVFLKDITVSDLFIVIYNISEINMEDKKNILQLTGWTELGFITMLKKIYNKDCNMIKIDNNSDELEEITQNKEDDVLENIFNNPTSLMIKKILM